MQCKFLLNGILKNLRKIHMIVFLSLGLFSSHGVCKESTPAQEPVLKCTTKDSTQGPRLEATKRWLGKFLLKLCESPGAKEGWALYDEGGLGGGGEYGQVMLISGDQGTKVLYVQVSGKDFKFEKDISKNTLEKFLSVVKTKPTETALQENWDEGFDMFERELVHVEKEGTTLTIAQRVKWRFGRTHCVKHCKIEQAFQALVK